MLNSSLACRIGRLFERHEHLQSAGQLGQRQTDGVRSVEAVLSHLGGSTQSRSAKSCKQREIDDNFGTVRSRDWLN